MDQILCNNLLKLRNVKLFMQSAKTKPSRLSELIHSTKIRGSQIPESLVAIVAVANITLTKRSNIIMFSTKASQTI